tara:strand:- start:24307 stop:24522 length:216 start_codon:yes stop_codon:yes gene_type:complete
LGFCWLLDWGSQITKYDWSVTRKIRYACLVWALPLDHAPFNRQVEIHAIPEIRPEFRRLFEHKQQIMAPTA